MRSTEALKGQWLHVLRRWLVSLPTGLIPKAPSLNLKLFACSPWLLAFAFSLVHEHADLLSACEAGGTGDM